MAKINQSKSKVTIKEYFIGAALFYLVIFIISKLSVYFLNFLSEKFNIFNYQFNSGNISADSYAKAINDHFWAGLSSGAFIVTCILVLIGVIILGDKYFVRKSKSIKELFINTIIISALFLAIDYVWLNVYGAIMNIRGDGGFTSIDLFYPISGAIPIMSIPIAIILIGLVEKIIIQIKTKK